MWDDGQAGTGQVRADRAHGWGWTPAVGLAEALDEVAQMSPKGRDVIELVRAVRCRDPQDRPDLTPPTGKSVDDAGC